MTTVDGRDTVHTRRECAPAHSAHSSKENANLFSEIKKQTRRRTPARAFGRTLSAASSTMRAHGEGDHRHPSSTSVDFESLSELLRGIIVEAKRTVMLPSSGE
jgi:hypothetical protein